MLTDQQREQIDKYKVIRDDPAGDHRKALHELLILFSWALIDLAGYKELVETRNLIITDTTS